MSRTFKKAVDIYVIYEFIKRLSTPFSNTTAFKMGLVDAEGKNLKSRDKMTSDELGAYTYFDMLVFNLKRLLNKLPGGENKIKTFAVALWLLKEEAASAGDVAVLSEDQILEAVERAGNDVLIIPEKDLGDFLRESDAVQTNTVGGIGSVVVDPVVRKKLKVFKRSMFMGARAYHVDESTFIKCASGKTDKERFSAFVGEPDLLDEIRGYAKERWDEPILVHNEKIGSYHFLKYGKRFRAFKGS